MKRKDVDFKKVKAFVFDVDGVFSTATLFVLPDGEPLRSINIRDGYAVQYAVKKKFPLGIITGGTTENIRTRYSNLGVKDIYLGSKIKTEHLTDFISRYNLDPATILYMGDDLPDYHAMRMVGFPVCPADAEEEIKNISLYISPVNGGYGCVRDIIEKVFRSQEIWMDGSNPFNW